MRLGPWTLIKVVAGALSWTVLDARHSWECRRIERGLGNVLEPRVRDRIARLEKKPFDAGVSKRLGDALELLERIYESRGDFEASERAVLHHAQHPYTALQEYVYTRAAVRAARQGRVEQARKYAEHAREAVEGDSLRSEGIAGWLQAVEEEIARLPRPPGPG